MDNGKVNWRGCFPAAVTPFTKDGAIDDAKFARNLEIMIDEGAGGLVICGHSGEHWALSREEKIGVFKHAVEVSAGRVPVIGCTSDIVTAKVIDESKAAKEVGCEGVMVTPPYYVGLKRNSVTEHFRALSGEARIPIMLYNYPEGVGVNLDANHLEELVEIDYVCAIKESTADIIQIAEQIDAVGDRMRIFVGHSAKVGFPAVMLGSPGFVGSVEPQVMGREGFELFRLSDERKIEEARKVQFRTLKCSNRIGKIGSFPANLKAAMNMLGRPGGYCRAPVMELTNEELQRLEALLDELGLMSRSAQLDAAD